MKLSCATQFSSVVAFVCLLMPACSFGQPSPDSEQVANAVALSLPLESTAAARAFPRLLFPEGIRLDYVGMYSPDAVFRTPSKFASSPGQVNGEGILPARLTNGGSSPEVPPWMLLTNERVVENMEPPSHARTTVSAHSQAAMLRNRFITSMYGRPSVIHAPQHLVTDSQQRVIVSDPMAHAIHVLDPKGHNSFRILTGKGYRVHVPAGVAVDSDDNIYVADSEHGMVVLFDRAGNFLRYIGSYHGEPEYSRPDGIAIDQLRKRLFLVDTPRNLVFELTLDGKQLRRAGKFRNGSGIADFEAPIDVTVTHNHVFVLNHWGRQVQVLDMEMKPVGKFDFQSGLDPQFSRENGLGSDQAGNVYVSLFKSALVRIYSPEGRLLASFGRPGAKVGEFASPQGLWIDSKDRLYVADAENGRVQVFQIGLPK